MTLFDDLFSSIRIYRALRGGAWRRLEFSGVNGGTTLWTRNTLPHDEQFVVSREFYSPFAPEEFSDGYHSVSDLYLHRHYLYCAFLSSRPDAWKARVHRDGTSLPGWFVAGCLLDNRQITYHMPDFMWDLCPARALQRGEEFDGHSSDDVLTRMAAFLKTMFPIGEQ